MPDMKAIHAEVDAIYSGLTEQPPHTPEEVKICKELIELYVLIFLHNMYDEGLKLLHKDYIQHNLMVGTGAESIVDFAKNLRNPDGSKKAVKLSFKRVLVDGEYVVAQMEDVQEGDGKSIRFIDIYRYQNGVFVEHWDAIQPIPPRAEWKNDNGPF